MSNSNHITRRSALRVMGLGTLGVVAARGGVTQAPLKPNFVLINVDDLGWTDLGCFGSEFYETPHIDRLAKAGMKFTDAYASCAVCSPTRAAIMTGRYPARLGLTDWLPGRLQGMEIPADRKHRPGFYAKPSRALQVPYSVLWMELNEITIAEALKPAGYTSCHIGKWHLGFEPWSPEKQGFDINLGGGDNGQPMNYFDPYTHVKLPDGLPCLPPRKEGEYLTDREGDEAVNFLRKHKDKPFFLHMCHYAVHQPVQAKKSLIEKYEQKPAAGHSNAKYAAMVESVDDAVGRIVDTIDELGLAERTVIIFTSDNGGLKGTTTNEPLREGKGWPYEGGIRIPQIAVWQGRIQAGSICHDPVQSIDFFPTVCAMAGVPLPTDRAIDGVDLSALLTKGATLKERPLFWHFPHYRGSKIPPYSIVRLGKWKLIKRWGAGKDFELYNLVEDIAETRDLAEELPDQVSALNKVVLRLVEDTGARLPTKNPDYKEA